MPFQYDEIFLKLIKKNVARVNKDMPLKNETGEWCEKGEL